MQVKTSAGLLMYNLAKNGLQVLLAHPGGPYFANKDDGFWGIPKGETEPGEVLLEAAIREFCEETGIQPCGDYISLGNVILKSGKNVHAWAFRGIWHEADFFLSNTFSIEWPPKSGRIQEFPEIDRIAMFSVEDGLKKITPAQAPFISRLRKSVFLNSG